MSVRQSAASGRTVVVLLPGLLLCACAQFGLVLEKEQEQEQQVQGQDPRPPTAFEEAVALVERGSIEEADGALRQVASACESGVDGMRALILLATLALDPRNRRAHPDSAALLAARYLFLPESVASDRLLAQSLYSLALDQGADPALRPTLVSGPGLLAPRFSNCTQSELAVDALPPLPPLGRESRASAFRSLLATRDSLQSQMARSEEESRAAQSALQTELDRVQAELQRIRRLLGAGPDTTLARPRGR